MAVRQLAGHEEDGACNASCWGLRACGSRERWGNPLAPPPCRTDGSPAGQEGACLPAPARPDRGDGRRGARHGAQEIELNADEIDALGAYAVGEGIQRTVRSNALGDDPVVIVNGQRVANPGVFSRFPSDALVRVEVLPRGAGAQHGGDLSRRGAQHRAATTLQEPRRPVRRRAAPAAGGMSSLVRRYSPRRHIRQQHATQFGIRAARDTALLGAERSRYLEDHPGHEAVSLRPSVQTMDANPGADPRPGALVLEPQHPGSGTKRPRHIPVRAANRSKAGTARATCW